MSAAKVLLLHGPLESVGINAVTQRLFPNTLNRTHVHGKFYCHQNVLALSHAFRSLGFRIAYSGWNEDQEWLEANQDLFDCLVLSDQTGLKSEDVREGLVIPNNKEKFFYAAYRGLEEIERKFGSETAVFRLRSDIAVRPDLANAEITKVVNNLRLLLIEYIETGNILKHPDFMMVGGVAPMKAIYHGMYTRSITGNSYHISSHIDHSLTVIGMVQQGQLDAVHCMPKGIFDSVIWRGVPRYLEYMFPEFARDYGFDCALSIPAQFDIEAIVAAIPPALSGRERK